MRTTQRVAVACFMPCRPMANSWRILLVEDDPALGPITIEVLTSCGHYVVLANSFKAAYNYLRPQHAVQAILLDLQLGLQGGEDLIAAARPTPVCAAWM